MRFTITTFAILACGICQAQPIRSGAVSITAGPAGGDLTGTYPNPTVSAIASASNAVFTDSVTIQGAGFSVGTSTLVTVGGDVGIGTTSLGAKLDVSGQSGGYVQKWSSGTAAGQALAEITYNAAGVVLRAAPNKALGLGSGESTNFTIPVGGATTGGALCLNGSNILAKCTSAIDASGNCTCP